MTQQLALDLNLPVFATFENFIKGANVELVNFLSEIFVDRRESYTYIWGAASTGKTHLLHACCNKIVAKGERAFYLDLSMIEELQPEILSGLETYDLICLDNIPAVIAYKNWQEKLFYFYNRCRDKGARLLISADRAPASLKLELADLQSRLSWGLILHLEELTDAEKIMGLQIQAKLKGINLTDEVGLYILSHHSRDMQKLMRLLDRIDKQTLIEKRRVTIPFLKSLINEEVKPCKTH